MRNKLSILALGLSILFLAASCAAAWFFYHLTLEKHSRVETAQAQWQAQEDHRSDIRQLERVLEDIEPELAALDRHFARSLDVVPLLDNLEQTGAVAGAKVSVTSVDREDESKSLSVGITASGTWSAVYKFILLLENSPYELEFILADIKSVPSGEEVSGSAVWEGVFKIRVISFLP